MDAAFSYFCGNDEFLKIIMHNLDGYPTVDLFEKLLLVGTNPELFFEDMRNLKYNGITVDEKSYSGHFRLAIMLWIYKNFE